MRIDNPYFRIACVLLFLAGATASVYSQPAAANQNEEGIALRDLVRISGIRTNQLIGYGLVVGLAGTGDSRTRLASESVTNLLGGLGQNLESPGLNARNIAAVLVTAEVPPFARPGDRINVTVSSIGDARSLRGGVLIQTPLHAGNNTIYAVAQGAVTTGAGGPGSRAHIQDTVGLVLNGATMEREVAGASSTASGDDPPRPRVRVSLRDFDFSTLQAVRERLTAELSDSEVSVDGGSILITLPEDADPVAYIARLESIRVVPVRPARIVINERTGTIVMGGDVRVAPVAVSRGGLELIVTGNLTDPRMGIHVPVGSGEPEPVMQELSGSSVQEIIQGLNAMGLRVRDVIAILEALRDAGALHAELIVN
ncbi:MAG: flagellar basal body P-ring protein FlgI [Spirochaetales bacterium]|nr:flagellar basal body P-ring protein FlgI [Leptospiraceae bacterium]MCP5480592.1 flagellar basal body P-ring protein FlgI [Spirochaetales bacterium]MCP5483942.1 flagellar basal body P-ring protein FlgI [Spirochaetales bacterium]